MIVDDGSDDGMDAVARELARRHDWILVTGTGEDSASSPRVAAAAAICSPSAAACAPCRVRSTSSSRSTPTRRSTPDYFDQLLQRFVERPDLGIGGGCCYELARRRSGSAIKASGSHPRGASRAYRWALLDDVFALEPELGWDGVDEVMAELRGFSTAGFQDFGFRHHRQVGEREGRLRAGSALGRQAWYMGYRPSYLLLRAVYRARENLASLAMVWGYAAAAVTAAPRCPHAPVTERVRDGQRLRVVMRRGRWT